MKEYRPHFYSAFHALEQKDMAMGVGYFGKQGERGIEIGDDLGADRNEF